MRVSYGRVRTACSTSFSSVLYHSFGSLSIGFAKIFFCFFVCVAKGFYRLFPRTLTPYCVRAHSRARAFAFLPCRAWWQDLRHRIQSFYVISRGHLCSAAQKGRARRERPGAFLGHFLPRSKKCRQKNDPRSAKQYARPATQAVKTAFYYDIIFPPLLRHPHMRQTVAVKTLKKCYKNQAKF